MSYQKAIKLAYSLHKKYASSAVHNSKEYKKHKQDVLSKWESYIKDEPLSEYLRNLKEQFLFSNVLEDGIQIPYDAYGSIPDPAYHLKVRWENYICEVPLYESELDETCYVT